MNFTLLWYNHTYVVKLPSHHDRHEWETGWVNRGKRPVGRVGGVLSLHNGQTFAITWQRLFNHASWQVMIYIILSSGWPLDRKTMVITIFDPSIKTLILKYRKHRPISRTFLLKIFVSNRGCGLSARTCVHHAVNLYKLTLLSEKFTVCV